MITLINWSEEDGKCINSRAGHFTQSSKTIRACVVHVRLEHAFELSSILFFSDSQLSATPQFFLSELPMHFYPVTLQDKALELTPLDFR